ncbi:metallophosphoesterase [uncultured Roseobacter sp.]|uniref:metallophosphoesterase family protein n=1 Tax=uncultured Roseobacter sp. TaxID=114847 RepID=UPI00261C5FD5|nr:metallophosphoesterase [uncultured Roseobacter sp.]
MEKKQIESLKPNDKGHQFVFYGDSCSGVPEALHEEKLAKVNDVVQRLTPAPEFIIFPGDEVIGLIPDETELREQWKHFFEVEMAWLDRAKTPMYHSTGNHTTYDKMSERVFADVMSHLPRNGPEDQQGLSYFVRNGDLLFVFVHTLWSELGGEGHLELEWLSKTLESNADARWKFVVGHHPAFTVNGFAGTYQRNIGTEYVEGFWSILTENSVFAYLCSHILAFDVQCHRGVLQITSAGAGTAHRMPEGFEYLHCAQMAVDQDGLRYQVLDEDGALREKLSWPPKTPVADHVLPRGQNVCSWAAQGTPPLITCLKLEGSVSGTSPRQTILAALDDSGTCPLWIGLVGQKMQLTVVMQPQRGRSPHQWLGPCFADGEELDLELMLHSGMGPGGILWRKTGTDIWNGLVGMSAWGIERLIWPKTLSVGEHGNNDTDTRFAGSSLSLSIGTSFGDG